MTTQTHVCSVAGCPQPVTLMTSLNGNPLRAYCATHAPVVYTQPAPPAQPDAAARDASWLRSLERVLQHHADVIDACPECTGELTLSPEARAILAARAAAGGRDA